MGEQEPLTLQLQLVLAIATAGRSFLTRARGRETLRGVAREEKGSGERRRVVGCVCAHDVARRVDARRDRRAVCFRII